MHARAHSLAYTGSTAEVEATTRSHDVVGNLYFYAIGSAKASGYIAATELFYQWPKIRGSFSISCILIGVSHIYRS
jgi:hypothetical protein